MKKFFDWLLSIGKDKWLHFLVNVGLALTGFVSYWLAIGLCVGASCGKEYGDSQATGNYWSWKDLIADALGMAVGLLIVWLVRSLLGF